MKCENANHVCDKNQYKEASFLERVKLTIHLIYCRACRKYSVRNNKLSNALKTSDLKSISQEDKSELKERLHQEMSK